MLTAREALKGWRHELLRHATFVLIGATCVFAATSFRRYNQPQPALLAEEAMAIGFVRTDSISASSHCSAVLIEPQWVLTAWHCQYAGMTRIGFGSDAAHPHALIDVVDTIGHDVLDLVLLKLARPPGEKIAVTPISVLEGDVDASWLGARLLLAGFGKQPTGQSGLRRFLVEPVIRLDETSIDVHSGDAAGPCAGDSGGPLLRLEPDGSSRVVGILSVGSNHCTGRDRYLRVDAVRDWISRSIRFRQAEGLSRPGSKMRGRHLRAR